MALTKKKKVEIVDELTGALKGDQSIVFVNFHGLTVADGNGLRRSLDKASVGYRVAKKTLLKRVLDQKGITGEMPVLDGEIAIAYGTDVLAPAREVYNFGRGKDTLKIVGGIFEGAYVDSVKMLSIATIPPREVLLSQLAFLLKSPLQRFAIALGEVAKTKSN